MTTSVADQFTPFRWRFREIDIRAGVDADLPLMSVSLYKGVVPRSELMDSEGRAEDLSNYKVCEPGDIVLNRMSAYQGALGLSQVKGLVSPDYAVLRPESEWDGRYLVYLMKSQWFLGQIVMRLKGIGSIEQANVRTPRINIEDLGGILAPAPPIDEQRRIADFLDDQVGRIDQAIELRRGQRKLIEQQIRSLITKMVTGGEGDESGDPRRTPAMTGRKVAYLPLRHIADVRSSNVDKKTDPEGVPVRLVNYTDVYYQTDITPSLDLMHATATREQLERFRVMPGDSIITKDSETPQDIAVSAYVSETDSEMVCGYHLSILRPGPVVDPKFFYWALTSEFVREQFSAKANGMTRFGLGIDSIRSTTFPVPTIEEQRRIADFLDDQVARRHDAMAHLATSIASFEERKRSLITAVVTGQLDVTAARPVGVGS